MSGAPKLADGWVGARPRWRSEHGLGARIEQLALCRNFLDGPGAPARVLRFVNTYHAHLTHHISLLTPAPHKPQISVHETLEVDKLIFQSPWRHYSSALADSFKVGADPAPTFAFAMTLFSNEHIGQQSLSSSSMPLPCSLKTGFSPEVSPPCVPKIIPSFKTRGLIHLQSSWLGLLATGRAFLRRWRRHARQCQSQSEDDQSHQFRADPYEEYV